MVNPERQFPPHAFAFKLGGGKSTLLDPAGLFGPKAASPSEGIDSLPVPLPVKPVTSSSPAVIQAEQDYAQASMLKKSVKKTIFAGDTGGYGGTQKTGMNPLG